MMDLRSLNPQQRQAVETLEGPVMILAGAGTGKTRVITCRIAHLIDRGVEPGRILGVTFTNKAAREMQERVATLVPGMSRRSSDRTLPRPVLCTFHSLCVRILRRYAERLGYKPNFVIYDESEQLGAVRKILSHISGAGSKVDPAAVLGLLSRYRNGGAARGGEEWSAEGAEMAVHIQARYESALRACNAMDFDDLILHTLRLFREHEDVLEACRERYRYVMVDEYQDTNDAQFRLVQALTREHRNLCVVGDDDQSIYGWRGAEIANLLDMERHYPEVKVIKLEQNYRSTGNILAAANAVIRHNARRRGKNLWSAHGAGEKITLHSFDHEEAEARAVVEEIEFARQMRGIPWGSQAILFRTNGQSRPLEIALRQAAVRYTVVGGQSFFDRREIRDFVAYLKVFSNPRDEISLLRIANMPPRGLSDATMEKLLGLSHQRGCPVYEVMRDAGRLEGFTERTRQSLAAFVSLIERHRAALNANQTVALRTWSEGFLRETGYVEELRRSEKEKEAGENRVRNLLDLAGSLDETDAALTPVERLQDFLENLVLDRERESEESAGRDEVTLITIHSCKGLEFPHVYLVGVEDGLLPHGRSKLEGTVDEERRLFYVAMTRARTTLWISHCAGRRKYGQISPCQPSPFLREIPENLVQAGGSREPVSTEAGKSYFAGLRAFLEGK